MPTLASPAGLFDIATCMGRCAYEHWAVARYQIDAGPSWALRDDDGEAMAVAGMFPMPSGEVECWFMAGKQASASMLPIVRAIRLTLARSSYRSAYVVAETPEGARLARLCGFKPDMAQDGLEVWTWAGSSVVADRTRRQGCKSRKRPAHSVAS